MHYKRAACNNTVLKYRSTVLYFIPISMLLFSLLQKGARKNLSLKSELVLKSLYTVHESSIVQYFNPFFFCTRFHHSLRRQLNTHCCNGDERMRSITMESNSNFKIFVTICCLFSFHFISLVAINMSPVPCHETLHLRKTCHSGNRIFVSFPQMEMCGTPRQPATIIIPSIRSQKNRPQRHYLSSQILPITLS